MVPDRIKKTIDKVLAVSALLASLTPTTLDDQAVEFLRYLLQDTESLNKLWLVFEQVHSSSQ